MKQPMVYIMASGRHGTLYNGVTSAPLKRIHEHKDHAVKGFTSTYNCNLLVWYEQHETMDSAIRREKRLKKYKRDQKIRLIEQENSEWRDLWPDIAHP